MISPLRYTSPSVEAMRMIDMQKDRHVKVVSELAAVAEVTRLVMEEALSEPEASKQQWQMRAAWSMDFSAIPDGIRMASLDVAAARAANYLKVGMLISDQEFVSRGVDNGFRHPSIKE